MEWLVKWEGGGGRWNYYPFILLNEINTMLSQLAKQCHWNISADSSIADEKYVLSRKNMAVNWENISTRLDVFLRIRRRLPFCNELQAEIKTCIFYHCRLGWFLQTDLGRPLHCDTRRTKLVNEGFTRIHACVVTYYFVCLDRKQFFSSRTPLLRIFVIAYTKSPPDGVCVNGSRLYTVLLWLKFQNDVEKQR